MKPRISLRQSLQDPNLLGGALTGESWAAWRTLLVASMGEELTEDERATFRALTGREREPLRRVDQFAAVIGRRGGKSRAMATLACYLAGLCEHTDALVPGERGVLLCVALDQRVAKIIPRLLGSLLRTQSDPEAADREPHCGCVGADQRHYLGGPPGVVPQIAWPDLCCGNR